MFTAKFVFVCWTSLFENIEVAASFLLELVPSRFTITVIMLKFVSV